MPAASSLIITGSSAGGMPALIRMVERLPGDLRAAVLCVQHFSADMDGWLPVGRLAGHTALRCHLAKDGMIPENGSLYLAPPDHHLLVKDGRMLVTRGPRENRYRPAADTLFRSAAVAYGPRVTGVILTGMLHDGAAGLECVKRCGGLVVVQDPGEAEYPSMPETALAHVRVDFVSPLERMGPLLVELVERMNIITLNNIMIPEDLKLEAAIAERLAAGPEELARIGELSALTCPDCGGSLWEMKHGELLRYRCHTGHAFSAPALLQSGRRELEEAMWVALRLMEEQKMLLSGMAARGGDAFSQSQRERADEMKRHIARLREFLLNGLEAAEDGVEKDRVAARPPD